MIFQLGIQDPWVMQLYFQVQPPEHVYEPEYRNFKSLNVKRTVTETLYVWLTEDFQRTLALKNEVKNNARLLINAWKGEQ
jgi:hypothetical protein